MSFTSAYLRHGYTVVHITSRLLAEITHLLTGKLGKKFNFVLYTI
jgi:hypothetical protein